MYLGEITDEDYTHAQKIFEVLKLKILVDYHDLFFQSNTLLLADEIENFRNRCIEIYELDPAWQACSKKTEIKLELLTKIDMLLMADKGIRGGIGHAIPR